MAFNPIITQDNIPLLYPGEEIMMNFNESYSTLEFSNGLLKNREPGILFLTNARLLFIHSDLTKIRQNFALHLNLISDENFVEVEKILTYQGKFTPYANFMPEPGKFKIEIKENFDEFKQRVQNYIRQIKMANLHQISNGISQAHQAFVDPNNPDVMIMVNDPPNSGDKKVD